MFSHFSLQKTGQFPIFSTQKKKPSRTEWAKKAKQVFANREIPMHSAEVMFAIEESKTFQAEVYDFLKKSGLEANSSPTENPNGFASGRRQGNWSRDGGQHYGETKKLFLTCFGDGENDLALFAPAGYWVAVSELCRCPKEDCGCGD